MSRRRTAVLCVAALVAGVGLGCGSKLDREALLDPQSCAGCHPQHYAEWRSSMHAYAADDPVFLAMNERGQRETDGALKDFCVKCHAPMALREGATVDGLNLASVPRALKGVTCFFCHSVDGVQGEHGAQLSLADDLILRAGIADPVENDAHQADYSVLMDRNRVDASRLCGACHDVVTPKGVHLERTFLEWKTSLYARDTPAERQTCTSCHLPGRDGLAAEAPGVSLRRVHDRTMPAVDVALTPFFRDEEQRRAAERELYTTISASLCVLSIGNGVMLFVTLENIAAGHGWPSGAGHNRRAFVELIAYQGEEVLFQSGVVPDGAVLDDLEDPDLWRLGDRIFANSGQEVHMFWDADRVESVQLPAPITRDPLDPAWIDTHVVKTYGLRGIPDRITLRLRLQPVGLAILDDLIASRDLDPVIRERMPTYSLASTQLEWRLDSRNMCVPAI